MQVFNRSIYFARRATERPHRLLAVRIMPPEGGGRGRGQTHASLSHGLHKHKWGDRFAEDVEMAVPAGALHLESRCSGPAASGRPGLMQTAPPPLYCLPGASAQQQGSCTGPRPPSRTSSRTPLASPEGPGSCQLGQGGPLPLPALCSVCAQGSRTIRVHSSFLCQASDHREPPRVFVVINGEVQVLSEIG